jgi:hypothetical protein
MALINTITVDLSANTVVLSSIESGSTADILTYTLSLNTVTFSTRPAITLSGSDFYILMAQMRIFHQAIITNFNPNQFATIPFTGVNVNEVHVSFITQWELEVSIAGASNFINNSASQGTNTVSLNNRTSSQILNFSEWQMVLAAFNHYEASLLNFLGP